MSGGEVYKLDCHGCGHTVMSAATREQKDRTCPRCKAILRIEWNAAKAEEEENLNFANTEGENNATGSQTRTSGIDR